MLPVVASLREAFGDERVSTNEAVRTQHGRDEGLGHEAPPDAAFYARSTEDVATAVRLCASAHVPVIAFGAGTSLEGHISAVRGGVAIDTSEMNRIVGVNTADL